MKTGISAAILAGGPARRMKGVAKPNIIVGGERIIARTLDTLKDLFDEIIIVTNTPAEFTPVTGCKIVADHYSGIGPIGGIHAALKAACGDAVFIFAGDMPLLSRDLIKKQKILFESIDCDILVPKTGSSVEPLHSIYRTSILSFLEEYLSGANDNAVYVFFNTVNTRYMELDETEELRNIFSNINLQSDIPLIEKIITERKS
jgi:molybdopterin-guanine dinucleotide biosynthesis protein A